jgi:acetyltransferase
MWHELLTNCSARSIWLRFRYLFKETTHEMATRFCFVDYDRTMAIVAEVEAGGKRQLIGVGRLVADPDHREAEYAVLVADAWQGRGLGSLITDFCFEISTTWGIDRVYAETTSDNQRMQNILRRHNFEVKKATNREVLYQTLRGNRPPTIQRASSRSDRSQSATC